MFRAGIILATVVALLAGSIGWPVSLYACEMSASGRVVKSSCPMCSDRGSAVAKGCHGGAKRKGSCCPKQQKVMRADTPVTGLSSLSFAPLAVMLVTFLLPRVDLHAIDVGSRFRIDHPPPILHHAQASYLFNATFLI